MAQFRNYNRPRAGLLGGAALLALASCAQPIGPTVQVLPPPGKSFEAFEADERVCSLHTNDVIRPMVDQSARAQLGTLAIGTVLGAAVGGAIGGGNGAGAGAAVGAVGGTGVGADQASAAQDRIQITYNNTYAACMVARGNQVPGPPPSQTVVVAPPVVVQTTPYIVPPYPVQ